jgi:hypothetical protein
MSNRVPYWVGVQQGRAHSDSVHSRVDFQLRGRITELEKENSELKNKLNKMENAFLLAIDLLMKKM